MKRLKLNTKYVYIENMNTFYKRFKGLMFNKEQINKAYLFNRTNGIHTFFMYQNIDVIMTDKNFKIIYIKNNLKPNRIILPKKNAYYTLELPIDLSNEFSLGEYLTIEEK